MPSAFINLSTASFLLLRLRKSSLNAVHLASIFSFISSILAKIFSFFLFFLLFCFLTFLLFAFLPALFSSFTCPHTACLQSTCVPAAVVFRLVSSVFTSAALLSLCASLPSSSSLPAFSLDISVKNAAFAS